MRSVLAATALAVASLGLVCASAAIAQTRPAAPTDASASAGPAQSKLALKDYPLGKLGVSIQYPQAWQVRDLTDKTRYEWVFSGPFHGSWPEARIRLTLRPSVSRLLGKSPYQQVADELKELAAEGTGVKSCEAPPSKRGWQRVCVETFVALDETDKSKTYHMRRIYGYMQSADLVAVVTTLSETTKEPRYEQWFADMLKTEFLPEPKTATTPAKSAKSPAKAATK